MAKITIETKIIRTGKAVYVETITRQNGRTTRKRKRIA